MRLRQHLHFGPGNRTALALASILGLLVASGLACSGNAPDTSVVSGIPAGGDNPQNGQLSVDEAAITGSVAAGKLHLSIPVHSKLSAGAQNTLTVQILSVDAAHQTSSVDLPFWLDGNQSRTVETDLALPTDISRQADLVRYVVRVTDGQASGLQVTRSLLYVVPRYDLRIDGPATLVKGKPAAWRARTLDPVNGQPVAGQTVNLTLAQQGTAVKSLVQTTGPAGDAIFDVTVDNPGDFDLSASTAAQGTTAQVKSAVTVQDIGPKVLLTTDKPIYQPGQKIYIRALSLAPRVNTPLANEAVTFEVLDGKGNKIMKRAGTSDAYGIASTTFQLGNVLNQGTFKVKVTAGSASSEKTVDVKPYALPKFKTDIQTDSPWYLPGQMLTGAVDAGYFFGKPVAGGDVQIVASTLDVGQTVFQTLQGKTDANGRFAFQLKLPSSLAGLPIDHGNALVSLDVTVTDTATQVVEKTTLVTVAQHAVDMALVPESTAIVPGVENNLELFVTDPLGAPSGNAAVQLTMPGGANLAATTDEYGYAAFAWTPDAAANGGTVDINARVIPQGGSPVAESFSFGVQQGMEHLVVRTDKAVYNAGDTVHVDIISTSDAPRVYVDWLNDGQVVDMRTLEAQSGAATFSMDVDQTLLGSNRIEAYIVQPDGNIVRTGRTVFARKGGSLGVELTTDKPTYSPGEPAKLTFSVKDEQGNPTVAALGVQIVDQAVFALVDAQPGLLRSYFELEDAFAQPQYEIEGPRCDMASTLYDQASSSNPAEAKAAQERAAATFAAMGDHPPTGLGLATWSGEIAQANSTLTTFYNAQKASALPGLKSMVSAIVARLEWEGCDPTQYYCSNLGVSFYDELAKRLRESVRLFDFWGNAFTAVGYDWSNPLQLKTNGPDEVAGTADDATITYSYSDLGLDQYGGVAVPGAQDNGWGAADAGAAMGGAGGGATGSGGAAGSQGGSSGAAEPRVRKDFPETLYVNSALITGPDGKATVDVGMADSITEWRVSSLANSASGKLGSGVDGITVFQDFFVDVSFPAQMTRGDEVQFPIAVYNYLTTPQTVQLELQAGDWYTPLGGTSTVLDLQPGEVTGVRFPVRVDKVGFQTLTVRAYGSSMSDAVARSVNVVPNGKAFPTSISGSLGAGEVTHTVSFPAAAVEGSPQLHVDVYPAFLSQVVKGMDSMLQVPNGCFEQTTSTTWPNVLVARYMTATNQITPDIQMKADSLISAGYQRLLTFEHSGGGFSWFGEQDPAPNVSVTAFGVMEFADMAKIATVDDAMLARTVNWLAGTQQADGSWTGETTEFFSFQTSAVRNTAFVIWALSSAGYQGSALGTGLAYIKAHLAGEATDSYSLALAANAAVAVAPNDPFTTDTLAQLDASKKVEGDKIHWDASDTQTNFYGSGEDANVAATALAAHAMLTASAYPATAQGALNYLMGQRDSMGNFGSTQATIWTLKALLLAATKGTAGAVGTMTVEMDGTPFTTLNLTADQSDVVNTIDLGSLATLGDHQVKLSFVGTGKPSYGIVSSYNLPWSDVSEPAGPLTVTVDYDKTSLALDETVNTTVHVTNNTNVVQHMVIVTVGIPPGFQVMTEDLQDELNAGTISTFETTGKQLILYVTQVPASGTLNMNYRLSATMPVTADDGGASVYPYYEPDAKTTSPSTKLTVSAN